MIEAYLRQLGSDLRVPRRLRRRILDEARDHLLELVDGGLGEDEAVRAFGAPGELARGFHEQLAGSSAHRASALTGVMLAVLAGLLLVTPGSWALAAVALLAGQVAAVAGGLALVRSLRYRAEGAVPAPALPDMYRANAIALACVETIVVVFAIGLALQSDPSLVVVVATAALGVAALGCGVALARSLARARLVSPGEPEDDAFDDLLALAERLVPPLAGAARSWPDRLRSHPWLFCAGFAAACGLAAGVGHAVTDGGLSGNVARMALGVLVIGAMEGAAVVLGYLALGGFLGIRRDQTHWSRT